MEFGNWAPLLAIVAVGLLPLFFALGWTAARIDLRALLKLAKSVPTGFYSSFNALLEGEKGEASRYLAEAADTAGEHQNTYELNMTLGRLYRENGESDKAITLHQSLASWPDTVGERRTRALYELGLDYQKAGLVDRAEQIFSDLADSGAAKDAGEVLLAIYEQDRDWEKAILTADKLANDKQTRQFEIAQFHCELAQAALFRSDFAQARKHVDAALEANKKCARANIIAGDIEKQQKNYEQAIAAYSAVEQQNFNYLGMVGERIYECYEALGRAEDGLNVLIGHSKTFPQLDLVNLIYDKALPLLGEDKANQTALELVRGKPDLSGVYRLVGLQMSNLPPEWKADADMIRTVIGQQIQKSLMYRCHHCGFKSQVFFWHCPACNKWETLSPNKVET